MDNPINQHKWNLRHTPWHSCRSTGDKLNNPRAELTVIARTTAVKSHHWFGSVRWLETPVVIRVAPRTRMASLK